MNETLDELHKTATETVYKAQAESRASGYGGGASGGGMGTGPSVPPSSGFAGFVSAFGKEIKKDLGIGR